MAGTSIKRKELKNKLKAKYRQHNIKKFTKKPVIRNIDMDKIKEEFEQKAKSSETKSKKKAVENEAQGAEKTEKSPTPKEKSEKEKPQKEEGSEE
jgi:hypothetical protein